jgi:hypothetical protein
MRYSWLIVLALSGALALGGCGGGDDGDDSGGAAATPTATSEAPAEETATPTPTETPDPATVEGAPEDAQATQTVKARGARNTTIDLAVLGLEVQGKLATLTLSFTVHNPEAAPDADYSLYDLNGEEALLVSLIDPVNLRRYNVVKDSSGEELQSGYIQTRAALDVPETARYTYAAPPPDVTKIDVSVGDWPTFRDVPIQR